MAHFQSALRNLYRTLLCRKFRVRTPRTESMPFPNPQIAPIIWNDRMADRNVSSGFIVGYGCGLLPIRRRQPRILYSELTNSCFQAVKYRAVVGKRSPVFCVVVVLRHIINPEFFRDAADCAVSPLKKHQPGLSIWTQRLMYDLTRHAWRSRSRTPGPFPFWSMKMTPADSRAA